MQRLSAAVVGLTLFALLGFASYTVAPGDSLSQIAAEHGVSTRELAEANDIEDIDLIRAGQVLTIPGQSAAADGARHEVVPGDRLADIARAHGTTISAIAAANGLDDIDLIRIGQVLEIPGNVEVVGTGRPSTYRVTAGDALSLIAEKFGIPTIVLAEANAIADFDRIRIGDTLTIPSAQAASEPAPTPQPAPEPLPAPEPQPAPEPAPEPEAQPAPASTYVVQPGDALSVIARDHGLTTAALAEANGISDLGQIFVGQHLQIPGATGSAAAPSAPAEPAPAPEPVAAPIPESDQSGPQTVLEPTYHLVADGETLSSIAALFIGMTEADIAFANGFEVDAPLQAGSTLLIPVLERNTRGVVGPDAYKANDETFYAVQEGETMTSIAQKFGVDVNELAEINGIGDIRYVAVGHVLEIPANRWVCPLPDAIFINDWGFPRAGGRTHEGNDLFVAIGTAIAAPVSGVVTTKEGPVGGLQFNLVGDDGVTYVGTHLSAFGATGAVNAGEVIGYVGDSGNAAGAKPHLHFEMHPGGLDSPVNPYPTLVRACR